MSKISQPKRYPNNDNEEINSINYLKSKLPVELFKCQINERDKHPNSDGYIEIVESNQIPIGKIEVQVKTLPTGNTSFPCPTALISYSKVTTLPVVLICVDSKEGNIYWKHIKEDLLNGREYQKTITLKFSSEDLILNNLIYKEKWLALSMEYQKRINKFPLITEELKTLQNNNQLLDELTKEDRIAIQEYIDEINFLIDRKYKILKWTFFKNTWKLGVLIHSYTDQRVCYSLTRVEYGENDSLVKSGKLNSLKEKMENLSWHECDNFFKKNTQKRAATDFIGKYFRRILSDKKFSIRVKPICLEIIQSCLEKFEFCLGLDRKDTFSIEEIRRAFEVYLPYWCCTALGYKSYPNHIDPELIRQKIHPINYDRITAKVLEKIKKQEPIKNLPLRSYFYNFNFLLEALDYLQHIEVKTISKIYKRTYGKIELGGVYSDIVDYKNKKDAVFNMKQVFSLFEKTYCEFLRVNELPYDEFNITGSNQVLFIIYGFSGEDITVQEFYVDSKEIPLKERVISYSNDEIEFSDDFPDASFSINGVKYHCKRGSCYNGDFLLGKTPLYNLIIKYLSYGIEGSFGNLETYWGWLDECTKGSPRY